MREKIFNLTNNLKHKNENEISHFTYQSDKTF